MSADRSAIDAALRIRSGRDVERDHGVAELGLVGDADRLGRVEARDPAQPRAGERGERPDRFGQRRLRIADVRPQADVCADRRFGHVVQYRGATVRPAERPPLDSTDAAGRRPNPPPGARSGVRAAHALGRGRAGDARRAPPACVRRRRRRRRGDRRWSARRIGRSAIACASSSRRSVRAGSSSSARGRSRSPRPRDRRALVAVAADGGRRALANNRYSADVVAISRVETLPDDPGPPRRQRAAALARGGGGLPGRRPAPAVAARDRHRRPARPRPRRAPAGRRAGRRPVAVSSRGSRPSAQSPPTRAPSCWSPAGRRRRRWPGSSGTAPRGPGRWVEERGLRAASRLAQADGPTPSRAPARLDPRGAPRPRRAGLAGRPSRPVRRRGDRRQPRPPRPPGRCRGGRLARRRGSLRLRPAARRANRRSVAPRAHRLGRGGADPGPARWPHPRRAGRPARGRRDARAHAVEVTPGIRRDPAPDLDAVGQDEDLVARIHEEIARDGPITFARFMDLALYDPDGGYYRAEAARPGRDGDFLTAPEAHPIFGAALARAVADAWDRLGRPEPFVLREYGAGTGTLARRDPRRPDRRAPGPRGAPPLRPDRDRAAPASPPSPPASRPPATEMRSSRATAAGRRSIGFVLANEVLDALPVHRVVVRDGQPARGPRRVARRRVRRRRGRADDARPGAPGSPTESIELAEGQRAEICLAIGPWLAAAAAGLDRGVLLLIDYGYPAAELYDPIRRRDGTLRAYLRHRVHDDPYIHVGRQDLTAHVDVTAVERAAARGRPRRTSAPRPRPSSSSASARRTCSRRSRPTRRRPSRTTSPSGPP